MSDYKIILLLKAAVTTAIRVGNVKKGAGCGWEYLGPKLLPTPNIFWIFFIQTYHFFFFPLPFPFSAIPGNDSLWFLLPDVGNRFFISILFPKFGNIFTLPIFEFWGWCFSHSLTVPVFRERFFSIPFLSQKSFSLTPVNSWRQLYTTNSKIIYSLAGCSLIDKDKEIGFMDEDIPRIELIIAFTTRIATNCCNWLCHFNKLTLLCLFATRQAFNQTLHEIY